MGGVSWLFIHAYFDHKFEFVAHLFTRPQLANQRGFRAQFPGSAYLALLTISKESVLAEYVCSVSVQCARSMGYKPD